MVNANCKGSDLQQAMTTAPDSTQVPAQGASAPARRGGARASFEWELHELHQLHLLLVEFLSCNVCVESRACFLYILFILLQRILLIIYQYIIHTVIIYTVTVTVTVTVYVHIVFPLSLSLSWTVISSAMTLKASKS